VEEEKTDESLSGPGERIEDLNELWSRATQGESAAVYRRLTDLSQQHRGKTEVYLQLYWLLLVEPSLDSHRVPADWLLQGLLATGLAGPLRQLYREEIEADAAEAFSQRFDRLLEMPLSSGVLADVVAWRFQAGVKLGRWEELAQDVAVLHERFGDDDGRNWVRLLFGLADGLAWAESEAAESLWITCSKEIKRHEYLAADLPSEFDRFDLLEAASTEWQTLNTRCQVPAELERLLPWSWTRSYSEVRSLLIALLARIAENPEQWLEHLDHVQKWAPSALALLGRLLDHFEAVVSQEPPAAPKDIERLALTFLSKEAYSVYSRFRMRFLQFCLREAIAPEQIAEVLCNPPGIRAPADASFTQAMIADWPLRYVCRGCQLFWA
jgi:hypothetical protein